ncbi:NAD(P)/FAD-dependent oxidoreductase [Pontibacter sp. G13]|uniref:phytoene desaturase family protein n=1 Tax=Pontibacter sp. G13 TaxID=3074898 RepID=UPI00288B3AF4|nr:NAD(P)/FAD-dependent oxidoreductase [Pontibacter sp. G13]WNJ20665.1 NAD(P)/FAD-dependent oxidoreductase [Pontibacter sp. G13]
MFQSFKKKFKVRDHYDVIVVGSGLGGMTTAALMAREGKSVLILERHYTVGGYTHVFKRPGYEWDVGIHYVGEMNRKHALTRKLFDYVTDNQLEWADMGDVYDRVVIGDQTFDFVKGVSAWKAQMKAYFPEDQSAIDAYVDLIFQTTSASRTYFLDKGLPNLAHKVAGTFLRKGFKKFYDRTTLDVLQSITDNPLLIKVLAGQYGDYGLPPGESSFAMHAVLVKHYFQGGFFPVGGSSRIAETILPVVNAAGGTCLVNAEVAEIVIEGQKATGVRMKNGQIFTADKIVSGIGVPNTYRKLLPQDLVGKLGLDQQLALMKPSVAHACLYIGLNGSPEELNLPKANYWIYPEKGSHDECVAAYKRDIQAPFPVVYISFPSAKDPDWSNRYPGKSTIDIITLMPYEVFDKWEELPWKKRGEAYEALKESVSQRLLEVLYQQEPQLKGKVDIYELSTPLTTKHFVNYDRGEIYGIEHTPARFDWEFLRPKTPIKSLYLTGQDIVTVGVGGALASGLLTAGAMLGKNLMSKVMKWENGA